MQNLFKVASDVFIFCIFKFLFFSVSFKTCKRRKDVSLILLLIIKFFLFEKIKINIYFFIVSEKNGEFELFA
jgi:hypothetical protein